MDLFHVVSRAYIAALLQQKEKQSVVCSQDVASYFIPFMDRGTVATAGKYSPQNTAQSVSAIVGIALAVRLLLILSSRVFSLVLALFGLNIHVHIGPPTDQQALHL